MSLITTNNIIAPLKDQLYHSVTDTTVVEKVEPLCQQKSGLVLVNSGAVGDVFSHYYGRGIELEVVDAETHIEDTQEELAKARAMYYDWRDKVYGPYGTEEQQEKFEDWVEYNVRKASELEGYASNTDKGLMPLEVEDIEDTSIGKALETNLMMFVDKMSTKELVSTMIRMDKLRKSGELSWYYYTQCGLAVLDRLISRGDKTRNWQKRMDWFKKNKRTNHMEVASYEDRFYGEMSFNMEDAIDRKREAEQLAKLNNKTLEEMWYELCEESEQSDMGQPLEGYSEDLEQTEVDALLEAWESTYRNAQ
jgi:hypothetical protein